MAGSPVDTVYPHIEEHDLAKLQAQCRVQDLIGWESCRQKTTTSHGHDAASQGLQIVCS